MAKINVKLEYKEIVKMFNSLTGTKSLWGVFNDCIECYAISIQNTFNMTNYEELEQRYKDIMKQYTTDERQIIIKIFAKIVDMLEENPYRDLLGDLYMQLNMGSDTLGQFFTPYNVALAMAEMAFNKEVFQKIINEKGYITVNEPTVGGGANIIALCEVMKKNGINYQKQCVIQCQELSRITALMCYVVLSLLGCSAVIKVGDTLVDPFTNYKEERAKKAELWTTPFFHINRKEQYWRRKWNER